VPYGTRAPKEIQHHLSALLLCRPSVSATRPGRGRSGGSQLLDRGPPSIPGSCGTRAECPSGRAILMASAPPFLSDLNQPLNEPVLLLAAPRGASRPVRLPVPSPFWEHVASRLESRTDLRTSYPATRRFVSGGSRSTVSYAKKRTHVRNGNLLRQEKISLFRWRKNSAAIGPHGWAEAACCRARTHFSPAGGPGTGGPHKLCCHVEP
jgi:hypothetical protein